MTAARSWWWSNVLRFDRKKVAPWRALRNTAGVVLPLAIGAAMGNAQGGLSASIGALNVAVGDGDDPYPQRGARMFTATALCGLAVMAGRLAGEHTAAVVPLLFAGGFAAGMMSALGIAASDLATITLVVFVVYSGQQPGPQPILASGLLAAAGGAFQTVLSLALWPIRPRRPEQRELAHLYAALARAAREPAPSSQAPAASTASNAAQQALQSLYSDHSLEAERYLALLNQAERIRLSVAALARLRSRVARISGERAQRLDRTLQVAATLLDRTGLALQENSPAAARPDGIEELQSAAVAIRRASEEEADDAIRAMLSDALHQLEALSGQLRSVLELAAHSTDEGLLAYARTQSAGPGKLRLVGSVATLRANLNWQSSVFRHALRLGIAVAFGGALERVIVNPRSYWMPMTIALVLKPDFAATYSRGLLRLLGTLIGLALTTGLLRVLPASPITEIAWIAIFAYILRCFGPANYGIMAAAVSAMIVLMFTLAGTNPHSVILLRALNTVGGGVIALVAYAVWPTWERVQIRESMARMLDGYRAYFQTLREAFAEPGTSQASHLDRCRLAARLARSNMQTALERLGAEPGSSQTYRAAASFLANSHRLAQALIGLEAALINRGSLPARPEFRAFANDVDKTVYLLSAALRGATVLPAHLPDLREDHSRLIASGDSHFEPYALVNVETDRITNTLNTLAEQVSNLLTAR